MTSITERQIANSSSRSERRLIDRHKFGVRELEQAIKENLDEASFHILEALRDDILTNLDPSKDRAMMQNARTTLRKARRELLFDQRSTIPEVSLQEEEPSFWSVWTKSE